MHTGQSEDLNRQFARVSPSISPSCASKYPIYAELRNIFDLALVGALVREEGLADKAAGT